MAGLASRLCLIKHCDHVVSSHWRLSSKRPLNTLGVRASVQRSAVNVVHGRTKCEYGTATMDVAASPPRDLDLETLDRQIPQSPLVAAVARDGSSAAAWADRVRKGVRRNVPVRGHPGDRSDFKASDHNRQIVLFYQANMGTTPVSTKFEAEPVFMKERIIPLKTDQPSSCGLLIACAPVR